MRLVLLLLFLPFLSNAQKWIGQDDSSPIDAKKAFMLEVSERVATDTISIKLFLKNSIENLKPSATSLVLQSEIPSPAGKHYLFTQTLNGRKVFRGSVKINVSNDGRVLSLFDHTSFVHPNVESAFPSHQAYHDGLMRHYTTSDKSVLDHYTLEEVYFPVDNVLTPCIRLEVVEKTDRYYELVLDQETQVIYQNDLLSYAAPPETDSLVTMWVFNPDPLTSAGVSYGAPYEDTFDQDVVELNAERVSVQMPVTFVNDTFFLRSNFASIEDFSFPDTEPVVSLVPEFNFTRSQSGFEDVNAYYHINYFQQYIQSLGFTNIVNYPIVVDPHALGGSDNSSFNPGFNPPRLSFGEGGVDDAEDADVIIHEYGHAIMHSAAPGTNNGTERKSLDEAIGDYFASSYSRFLSPNRWDDVFTWDGHNEFWSGRNSVSTDHYPEDLVGNIYADADIWSATLMQIWGDIGRETTDAIMIQAGYSFSEGMTMPQAAVLFIQADELLFGGANFTPIRQRMYDRGLVPWDVGIDEIAQSLNIFSTSNSVGFASGSASLLVQGPQAFTTELYNAAGQLIRYETVSNGPSSVNPTGLSAGVYVLKMQSENAVETIKLIKH